MILFEVSANRSHRFNGLQRRAQSLRPMLLAFEWLVGRDPALRRPLKRAGSVKRSRSTAECPCTKVRFAGTFRVRLEGPFFSSAQKDSARASGRCSRRRDQAAWLLRQACLALLKQGCRGMLEHRRESAMQSQLQSECLIETSERRRIDWWSREFPWTPSGP
jgi:hypothetical protein